MFPQSMSPLAIGQERSVRLIDDVVSGDRLLALVTATRRIDRGARLGRPLRGRHRRARPQDDQGARRHAAHPRPGPRARAGSSTASTSTRTCSASSTRCPTCSTETPELEALTRNVQGLFARIIGLAPYLPEELQLAAANVDDPSALCAPRRLDAAHDQDRGAAGDPRAGRRRGAAAHGLGDPQPRAGGVRARLEDPVAGAVGDGEGPARVLPPPAAEGDPAGARRGRPGAGRGRGAARAARRARRACRKRCARPPSASSAGSRSCRPPRPSTASSARTSSGS